MEEPDLVKTQNENTNLIQLIEENGEKKIFVRGKPYMNWKTGELLIQKVAIIELYKCGLANQEELANIFGLHIKSIYNYIAAYECEGIEGLIGERSGPQKNWKTTPHVRGKILLIVLRNKMKGYNEIQKELETTWKIKVSMESIRQVLIENGFIEERIKTDDFISQENFFNENENEQLKLLLRSEKQENNGKINSTVKIEKKNRSDFNKYKSLEKNIGLQDYSSTERIYLDRLEVGEYNMYGGGLLLIPLLERYKFLETIKQKMNIETFNGYCMEQLCLTLFYFDIFAFHSIEDFKTAYPEEFGILMGKLNSPGIRTLRRFLHKIRKSGKSEELIDGFGCEYIKNGLVKYGIIYIDGHFLPYYGETEISMGWNTHRERGMKGSNNFIVNDEKFNPLIFLVRPSSEDLIEKISEVIRKIKEIGREAGVDTEKLTIIFDREGYSAELFRQLSGIDERIEDKEKYKANFISWAKYADKWIYDFEGKEFNQEIEVEYDIQKKEKIKYLQADRQMNKYGKIRAIVIESGSDKKRSAIYTNDWESEAGIIIQLICRRWGQENLIKALKLRYLIDYHPGYFSEELEEQPLVDNPAVEKKKQEKAKLQSKINEFKIRIADNILNESKRKNDEEIKKNEIEIKAEIAILNHEIFKINEAIEKLPEEIKYEDAHDGRKLFELNYEKKRFLDCIKVFAYHMEKRLCEILECYYDKKKELIPALAMIIRRGAYIKLEDGKLKVSLRRFKNSEIDYAARHLCDELNQMKPYTLDKFHLPIHYGVM
jgi:transposase